jgi:hypothetical protein
MRFVSKLGRIALMFCAGCSPFTAPLPFHMMESTEMLKAHEISLTAAIGGGGLGLDGQGFGGGMRLGVGVSDRHSLRLEATMIGHDTGDPNSADEPWKGRHIDYGWKLSWKYAPVGYFAFILGGGGSYTRANTGLGGDVAFLFGAPRALGGWFRPYGGVRVGVVAPVDPTEDSRGGVTEEIVVPLGMAASLTENSRLYLEGGYLQGFSQGSKLDNHSGLYGGIGVEIRHRN